MSNGPSLWRRAIRAVIKIFLMIFFLGMTFAGAFLATLVVKSENPRELLDSIGDDIFYEDDTPIKSTGTHEIKMLFDGEIVGGQTKTSDEKISPDEKKSAPEEKIEPEEPAWREERVGFFAGLNRMVAIKSAVEAKISSIPHYVTIDELPYLLRQAVVAVEDTRFYQHKGFDVIGIARAVFRNVESGEIREGASTITQQTVKNLFLTSDKTFTRKTEELILAMNMEKNFTKDKILEIYLNSIYFGSNFYGIYDAAHGYFGKEPVDLTIGECAMLAGLPNAPSVYSPYVDFHKAKQRQLVVIDAMEKSGVITKTEAESARVEEIVLAH